MMKALPKEVVLQIWRAYFSGVVLKQLYAKTARTGLINTPSSIRWRSRVERTAVAFAMKAHERKVERENVTRARKEQERAKRKRDFDDWFSLTGQKRRMSKRPKHFLNEDALGDF